MDIINVYIRRLIFSGLKLLLGLIWMFFGHDIVASLHLSSAPEYLYWFLSGLIFSLVLRAVFSSLRDLLIIFDVITLDSDLVESVYHDIIRQDKVAVAIKNKDAKYIYVNQYFCDIFGITQNYIAGKKDDSFMDELEVMKSTEEDTAVLIRGETLVHEEDQLVEGYSVRLRITKKPLYNKKNKLVGLSVCQQDISAQYELEKNNKDLKGRYKRLFDDLPFPTLMLDIKTTLAIEFNDALLEMLGYQRGEFFRTRLGLYMADEEEDTLAFVNQLVDDKGGIRTIQLISKNKDRYDVEAHFRVTQIKDKTYLHGIFRDITENKRATEALIQSEKNYYTLFNHANDAVFIIDPETLAIVDANQLAYIWLGYEEGELNSLSIFDIDRAGLEKVTRAKIAELSQNKDILFEHEMCTVQGDIVPVEISAHSVIYGNKLAYQYVVRDISERKVAEWALRESEERYWQMFENNSSIMLVLDTARWVIEDVNEAACKFYMIKKEDLVGSSYDKIFIGTDRYHNDDSSQSIKRKMYEGTHKLGNNEIRFVEINEAPIEVHGRQLTFVIVRDITDSKDVVNQLNLAQRMIASSSESVIVLDASQQIVSANNAAILMTGYNEAELLSQPAEIVLADSQQKIISEQIEQQLLDKTVWQGSVWNRKKTGERFLVNLHIELIKHQQQEQYQYVMMMSAVNEDESDDTKLLENNIKGLADKRHFIEKLEYALKKSRRSGKYLAVLLIDIKRFYQINEKQGYDIGDRLIHSVGKRLQFLSRESDYVSHFGADNFAMLLEDFTDLNKINVVAQKVLSTLSESYQIDDKHHELMFAVGISLFPEDGNQSHVLIKQAEQALMEAKRERKSSYYLCNYELNEKAKIWWDYERRLHDALRNDEFKLYFLPQYNLNDYSLSSIEVLLRWDHPERGILEPAELLVEAENTGYIVAIGDWVIRRACYDLKHLLSLNYNIPELVINISGLQIDENFLEFLLQVCESEGVAISKITLDMTESAMLMLGAEQIQQLEALRKAGIKLQIDDFGKGMSSISSLLEIDFDRVKMDARLIHQLVENKKTQRHCLMVEALSDVLDFKIIAEGVELKEQVTELKKMKCDFAQGHYFGEAMCLEDLINYLESL